MRNLSLTTLRQVSGGRLSHHYDPLSEPVLDIDILHLPDGCVQLR